MYKLYCKFATIWSERLNILKNSWKKKIIYDRWYPCKICFNNVINHYLVNTKINIKQLILIRFWLLQSNIVSNKINRGRFKNSHLGYTINSFPILSYRTHYL